VFKKKREKEREREKELISVKSVRGEKGGSVRGEEPVGLNWRKIYRAVVVTSSNSEAREFSAAALITFSFSLFTVNENVYDTTRRCERVA